MRIRSVIALCSVLVVLGGCSPAADNRVDPDRQAQNNQSAAGKDFYSESESRQLARNWIKNKSLTYTYDGFGLKFREARALDTAGCEDCYVAGPAPAVGQRRSRAVHCHYELSQEDCVSGRQFDDQIACFSFIDNGNYFVEDGGAYGIPFRALIPQGIDNLLIAGRMMTVDLVAHNSTRNTVCCLACGQAAGTGAALAAIQDTAPAALDPAAVRHTLSEEGVLLEPRPDPLSD